MTEPRTTHWLIGGLFGVVAVVAGGVLVACLDAGLGARHTERYFVRYQLEVANNAPRDGRVRVFSAGKFEDVVTGVRVPFGSGSGIIVLKSGERRVFQVSTLGNRKDSAEDNDYVRSFGRIEFFEQNSVAPYRSYIYPLRGCHDVPPGTGCGDDAWVHHRHPDGTEERLFVESPDRPFYLERDRGDPDLGRIVITFVPDVDAGSADAVN